MLFERSSFLKQTNKLGFRLELQEAKDANQMDQCPLAQLFSTTC